MLSKNKYLEVIKETTLTSIDLILINDNKIFLGWRNNQPAKNTWFTPGVRTYKNEVQKNALERLASTELNIKIDTSKCKLIGVYDHIYTNNFRNDDFGTHYVVSAYIYKLNDSDKNKIKTDNQHDNIKWLEINKLLDDNKVHQYVKNYYPQILKNL